LEIDTLIDIITLIIILGLLIPARKNTLLNLLLLTISIPFETYFNFKIGFTLKPAQIFAVTTFFSMLLNKERPFTSLKEHLPYLLILIAQVLSLMNAPKELIFKDYQGSIRMILNLGFLYFIAYTISYAVKNLVNLRKVVLTLIAGGALSVLIELARAGSTGWMKEAYLAWLPGGYIRLAPLNMWSNTFAGYLLIVLVFLTVYIFQRPITQNKLFRNTHPILLAIVLYGFILTFSRGAWLSYALASVIIVWYTKENIIKGLMRYAFCAGISLLLLLTVYPKTLKPVLGRVAVLPIYNAIFNISTVERIDPTTTERIDPTTTERIGWYRDSIEMFLSHPIIGNGWASNLIPHNIILQILSESGVIGLSAFTIFVFFVMRRSYRAVNFSHEDIKFFAVGIWAALWGTAIHLMTDIGLYHIQTWFIIGLALAMNHIEEIKKIRFMDAKTLEKE
jgi:O-antigen ligase